MKSILSERNIVAVLFVMVLITFSLAHEDTKKMEQIFQEANSSATTSIDPAMKEKEQAEQKVLLAPQPASYNQ